MEAIFLTLLQMSITASWLIAAVIVIRFILKKVPKNYFCILWGIVAFRLICPFSIESMFSVVPNISDYKLQGFETEQNRVQNENENENEFADTNLNQNEISNGNQFVAWNQNPNKNENQNENQFVDTNLNQDEIQSEKPVIDSNENQTIVLNNGSSSNNQNKKAMSITMILTISWFVGMGILFLYSIISWIKLKLEVSASLLVGNDIYICDNIRSPFIFGIFKPRIYVPSDLSEKQIECVLAHERMHLKRRDNYWKPFGFLLLIVYWFNPLVWIAYILFCRDVEMACDEGVIRKMTLEERATYLKTLIFCSNGQRKSFVYPLAFGEVAMKERVKSMMRYKKPSLILMIIASIICVTVVACFGTNSSKDSNFTDEPSTEQSTEENTEESSESQETSTDSSDNVISSIEKLNIGEVVSLEKANTDIQDKTVSALITSFDERITKQYGIYKDFDLTEWSYNSELPILIKVYFKAFLNREHWANFDFIDSSLKNRWEDMHQLVVAKRESLIAQGYNPVDLQYENTYEVREIYYNDTECYYLRVETEYITHYIQIERVGRYGELDRPWKIVNHAMLTIDGYGQEQFLSNAEKEAAVAMKKEMIQISKQKNSFTENTVQEIVKRLNGTIFEDVLTEAELQKWMPEIECIYDAEWSDSLLNFAMNTGDFNFNQPVFIVWYQLKEGYDTSVENWKEKVFGKKDGIYGYVYYDSDKEWNVKELSYQFLPSYKEKAKVESISGDIYDKIADYKIEQPIKIPSFEEIFPNEKLHGAEMSFEDAKNQIMGEIFETQISTEMANQLLNIEGYEKDAEKIEELLRVYFKCFLEQKYWGNYSFIDSTIKDRWESMYQILLQEDGNRKQAYEAAQLEQIAEMRVETIFYYDENDCYLRTSRLIANHYIHLEKRENQWCVAKHSLAFGNHSGYSEYYYTEQDQQTVIAIKSESIQKSREKNPLTDAIIQEGVQESMEYGFRHLLTSAELSMLRPEIEAIYDAEWSDTILAISGYYYEHCFNQPTFVVWYKFKESDDTSLDDLKAKCFENGMYEYIYYVPEEGWKASWPVYITLPDYDEKDKVEIVAKNIDGYFYEQQWQYKE